MRTAVCLLSIPLIALPSPVTAQAPMLEPGARIRVWAPELGIEKRSATFQALRGDTLAAVADSTMHCPLTSVTRLDVHRGRGGHARTGAVIGIGAGAVIGAVTAVIVCEAAWCTVDGGVVLAGAGIGVLTGGLLGAGVGALIKTDRWEEVPLDRLRVSVASQPQGVGLAISIAF
jgi:hypothetical protein